MTNIVIACIYHSAIKMTKIHFHQVPGSGIDWLLFSEDQVATIKMKIFTVGLMQSITVGNL